MFVCSRILVALWIAAVSLLPAPVRPQFPVGSGGICGEEDGGGAARLSALREDIVSKLSLFLSVDVSQWGDADGDVRNETRTVNPALVTAYEAVSQVLAEEDSAEPTGCARVERGRGTPAFAKRLSLFFADNASIHAPEKQDEDTPTQYTFIFNPTLPTQNLYSAELRLFKKISPRSKEIVFENVEVFYIERESGKEKEEGERILVLSKNVEQFDEEYEAFDVSVAMKRWIASGASASFELEVVINSPYLMDSSKFSAPSITFDIDNSPLQLDLEFQETRAQLVVATVTDKVATQIEKRRRRKRRQAVDTEYCKQNPNVIHCCIRRLDLNFHTDLNLPFVLYPPTFTPNYCQGVCPVPFLSEPNLRYHIRQFYQSSDLGGGPCCTIYGMTPLLMVIYNMDTGEVLMMDVPDMEITSCGCVE